MLGPFRLALLWREALSGGLLSEVGGFEDFGLLEDFGLDGVRCQLDVEAPLLNLLALGNHGVKLAD